MHLLSRSSHTSQRGQPLKPETPAQGIMQLVSGPDVRSYRVQCCCGSDDHTHDIWIEHNDGLVEVTLYTQSCTDWWSRVVPERYDIANPVLQRCHWFWTGLVNAVVRRLRLTWQLWAHGMIEYQSCVILDQQTATNYAQALLASMPRSDQHNGISGCQKSG